MRAEKWEGLMTVRLFLNIKFRWHRVHWELMLITNPYCNLALKMHQKPGIEVWVHLCVDISSGGGGLWRSAFDPKSRHRFPPQTTQSGDITVNPVSSKSYCIMSTVSPGIQATKTKFHVIAPNICFPEARPSQFGSLRIVIQNRNKQQKVLGQISGTRSH